MARQQQRIKAEAKAAQEVEQRMETAVQQAKTRKPITCSAEDIIRERDGRGLSWAQVAKNLDLGSPGAARKAYTVLTGKPHNESQMRPGTRAPRGSSVTHRKTYAVQWDDNSDQDEIIDRLQGMLIPESGNPDSKNYQPEHWSGSFIIVRRKYGVEEVRINRVIGLTFGPNEDRPLTVEVRSDTGAYRAFYVRDIMEVR